MTEIKRLSSIDEETKQRIIERQKTELEDVLPAVNSITDDVRNRGAAAVIEYAKKFDGAELSTFRVTEEEIARAIKNAPAALVSSLKQASDNITRFHRKQMPAEFRLRTRYGILGQKVEPFARVGIYAPGGTATYPSSVLMGCIPAKVARVPEIVLCTPPRPDGTIDSSMLVAADLAGATEIYKIGGAQAIAAMAYGINEMLPVEKIIGPGNKYVTAAKLIVEQDCDIEFLAGPSEILVIADVSADPEMVALDMIAQLEHDADAKAVLIALSEEIASRVATEIKKIAKTLPRAGILKQSIKKGCTILVTDSLEEAIDFANDYAPEHLLLAIRDSEEGMINVCNAGSIFMGKWSSVALGDYCTGPNHVLPTMGLALTRGALSPLDFVKLIPYQRISRSGAQKLSEVATEISRAEGLEGHAIAAQARARK